MRSKGYLSANVSSLFVLTIILNLLYFSYIPVEFQRALLASWDSACSTHPSSSFTQSTLPNQAPLSPLSYDLAYSESYGFFQDIPEHHWNLLRQISQANIPHMYPNNPLKYADTARRGTTPSWYQTNYEPDFSCQFERRVGGNGNGDGPKWVCDPHRIVEKQRRRSSNNNNKCLVYSIGSNGDFQFETALQLLLGRGVCEVHIFDMDDFSKEMQEWANRYNVTDLYFHKWGLTTNSTTGPTNTSKSNHNHTFKSISDIVQELGHATRKVIDIFKIDCESCEWDTFYEWLDEESLKMPRLQQILVELHRSPPTKVLPFFNALRQHGYAIFHKEANIQHSHGNCIEYGFLKLKPTFFQNYTQMASNNDMLYV